jgi:hypothetical protein
MNHRQRRPPRTDISRDRMVCPVCRRIFHETVVGGFCSDGHKAVALVRADAHLKVVR